MKYAYNPYEAKEFLKCKKRNLKVNGKGMIAAEPDIALISLAIATKDKNPQIAQNLNDQLSEKLINALMLAGIPKDDIKTESYTLFPEYDYVEGKQLFSGYVATHVLEIKVRDIKKAGEVISTAVQNGANQINRVDFTLEDAKYHYNRALKLAVKDATQKAQAIAASMKVYLDTIPCSVTEESAAFSPLAEQSTMKLAATAALVPGKIEIVAAVEAEFEYWP